MSLLSKEFAVQWVKQKAYLIYIFLKIQLDRGYEFPNTKGNAQRGETYCQGSSRVLSRELVELVSKIISEESQENFSFLIIFY